MGKERLKGFTSEITDDLYGEAQKVKSKNLHEKVQHVTSQADGSCWPPERKSANFFDLAVTRKKVFPFLHIEKVMNG